MQIRLNLSVPKRSGSGKQEELSDFMADRPASLRSGTLRRRLGSEGGWLVHFAAGRAFANCGRAFANCGLARSDPYGLPDARIPFAASDSQRSR